MNKKGKTQKNAIVIVVILALLFVGVYLFLSSKQIPKEINFGDKTSQPGGTKIELRAENGDTGYMGNDFYKIGSDTYSIIRGATTVSCSSTAECKAKPTCVGDTFCQSYITCYDSKCSYNQQVDLRFHTVVTNSGTAILNVTFNSAATNPVSTAFNTAYASNLSKSVILNGGQTMDFVSNWMPLTSYSTGTATIFTSGAYAINQYTGARIPTTGDQTSSVTFTIYPDPTGGLTVAISQLGGI